MKEEMENDLLIANSKRNNCIIITSIIDPTDYPLWYCRVRSVYSKEERFVQTIETIQSIRKYMKDVDIFLVECSPESSMIESLSGMVDGFVNMHPNDVIRNKLNKGIGEAVMLLHGIDKFVTEHHRNIFKISGRYLLNDAFDMNLFENDRITAKLSNEWGCGGMCTYFYKVPQNELSYFKECLLGHINDHNDSNNEIIENYLRYKIGEDKIKNVHPYIGVTKRPSTSLEELLS
jgi:hypothetical protein